MEELMALMKKGGGSDFEYIDEDRTFEFPTTTANKDFYVYSAQGKRPMSVFVKVVGAETTTCMCSWNKNLPSIYSYLRTSDDVTYTSYAREITGTAPYNGFNVTEVGADYVKFTFKYASGYTGTAVYVNAIFE